MDYLFAYAVEKARKDGYAGLAEHERWDWHGDVYGFRRVVLGAAEDARISPCDPDGKWFDAGRAKLAEEYYRSKLKGGAERRQRADNTEFEARNVENEWAQERGYNDFEHYKQVERMDHVDACVRLVHSLPGPKSIPRAAGGKLDDPHIVAAALGVRAREYTPDELRAGRIALGLEEPDDTTRTAGAA